MVWGDQEVEVPSQALLEVAVEGTSNFGHRSAGLADEVEMVLIGEVVDRRAVSKMSVLDQALALECIEGPIHGRLGDLRVLTVDALGELLGGGVARSLQERGNHGPALHGGPAAVCPERSQDVVDLGCRHSARLYRHSPAMCCFSLSDCDSVPTSSKGGLAVFRDINSHRLAPVLLLARLCPERSGSIYWPPA